MVLQHWTASQWVMCMVELDAADKRFLSKLRNLTSHYLSPIDVRWETPQNTDYKEIPLNQPLTKEEGRVTENLDNHKV